MSMFPAQSAVDIDGAYMIPEGFHNFVLTSMDYQETKGGDPMPVFEALVDSGPFKGEKIQVRLVFSSNHKGRFDRSLQFLARVAQLNGFTWDNTMEEEYDFFKQFPMGKLRFRARVKHQYSIKNDVGSWQDVDRATALASDAKPFIKPVLDIDDLSDLPDNKMSKIVTAPSEGPNQEVVVVPDDDLPF